MFTGIEIPKSVEQGGRVKPAQGRGKNRAEARYNSQRRYNTQGGKFYGQGVGTMIRKVGIMTKG